MTASPAFSPWPAPTHTPTTRVEPAAPLDDQPRVRHTVSAWLATARRYASRTERAEHAAAKELQRIEAELDDLPTGWFVVRPETTAALGNLDSDIDRVVLGPGGVFTIHLDHALGAKVWVSEHKLTINGHDSDRLAWARFEARRASGALTQLCGFDVTVQSVLVLVGATMQTVSRATEVHVRTQQDLRDWLCRQPLRLDSARVEAIHRKIDVAVALVE